MEAREPGPIGLKSLVNTGIWRRSFTLTVTGFAMILHLLRGVASKRAKSARTVALPEVNVGDSAAEAGCRSR